MKWMRGRNHTCGNDYGGVNDAPILQKTNFGITIVDASHKASTIVLTVTWSTIFIIYNIIIILCYFY